MNESAQPVVAALAMNAQTLDLAFGAFSALGHYGDGMSLYAYAGSNPVNRRDPLGLYYDPFEEADDIIAGMAGERAAAAMHMIGFFGAMGDLALATASIAFHGTLAVIIPGYAVALGVYGSANAILDIQENGFNVWNVGSLALNFAGAAASLGPAVQQLTRVGAVASRSVTTMAGRYSSMRMSRSGLSASGRARLGLQGICFAAGTLVVLSNGTSRPIESVSVGDAVMCASDEAGPPGSCVVEACFSRLAHETLTITMDDGSAVTCTAEHPFWSCESGWIEARDLLPGEHLRSAAHGSIRVQSVRQESGDAFVFNLNAAPAHTYFVGAAAVLVHNQCSLPRIKGATGVADGERLFVYNTRTGEFWVGQSDDFTHASVYQRYLDGTPHFGLVGGSLQFRGGRAVQGQLQGGTFGGTQAELDQAWDAIQALIGK